MVEDIYEPLVRYRDEFKEKFARIAVETFDWMTDVSAVDIQANRKTVSEIDRKTAKKNSLEAWRTFYTFIAVCAWIGGIGSLVYGIYLLTSDGDNISADTVLKTVIVFTVSLAGIIFFWKKLANLNSMIGILEAEIKTLTNTAWNQMAPLNALFNWDTLTEMVSKCVPRLEFDPYFRADRISELEYSFGFNSSYNDGKSILFAHSGVINGNPFVIAKYRRQVWGSKTYTGTRVITYTVYVTDSDGKRRRETRHETLVATVTKPFPEYTDESIVIYGNDAAPKLSFSREPSSHSGKDGFFSNISKKMELKKLEKLARNLDDDSDFTMMSNREFEVLFHAEDRDDEVEFRVLFTPLAQQQMVNLLNDTEVGYGDDFFFSKRGKLNFVAPVHLQECDIDVDPRQFVNFSYDRGKDFFVRRSKEFFKSVYFAMAPLLTIPIYQQMRTQNSIHNQEWWKGVSFWENESFANYIGESRFEHRKCITHSILKATDSSHENGGTVSVTAYGFRGEDRVDFVPVYGGDGKYHDVAVHWVEYLPVERTSEIEIGVTDKDTADAHTRDVRRRIYITN